MFRRLSDSLPKDPVFPANLEKLGYFINDKDQVRMINHPTEKSQYKINHQERINELYKEAHNDCIRREILSRLHTLGLQTLRLPLNTAPTTPHIPILTSTHLATAPHVLVYFGERNQDLGIFAYRIIGGDDGLNAGSAVDFVRAVQSSGDAAAGPGEGDALPPPAIVLANPGQLIWCRSRGRAVGRLEWENLPRASAVHLGFRLDEETGRNLVEGNRDEEEHVQYVFEHVLRGAGGGKARIDVIAAEWVGAAAVKYLGRHWSRWCGRINGICLVAPLHGLEDLLPHSPPTDNGTAASAPSFAHFISTRCRAYVVHEAAQGTLVDDGGEDYGCNVYASGERFYVECIMVRAGRHMLEWLARLRRGEEGAEEVWRMRGVGEGEGEGEGEGGNVGAVDEGWMPDGVA